MSLRILVAAIALAAAPASQARLLTDFNRTIGTTTSSLPQGFAVVGNGAFFSAATLADGRELWFTNRQGVRLAQSLAPGVLDSSPRELTAFGTGLLFVAGTLPQLYFHDPQVGTSVPLATVSVSRLTRSGSRVFFLASDAAHGEELWATDGTVSGTGLVVDLVPGPAAPVFGKMVPFRNGLAMVLDDQVNGLEIWFSDGTASGTRMLHDLKPGPGNGSTLPHDLAVLGNALFFTGDDGQTGAELWRSDGQTVSLVADLVPGPQGAEPNLLTDVGGELAFVARTLAGRAQQQAWLTAGTNASTRPIAPWSVAVPADFTALPSGNVVFVALDGLTERLAVTDRTANGARLLPRLGLDDPAISGVRRAGNRVYVFSSRVWLTDGTDPGTVPITALGVNATAQFAGFADGSAFFAAGDATTGIELWRSDGTAAGTGLFADIEPQRATLGSQPRFVATVSGRTLFSAINDRGSVLAATDGTTAGTRTLATVSTRIDAIATLQGRAIMHSGGQLLVSDGTAAGTNAFASVRIPPLSSPLFGIALDGSRALFVGSLTGADSQLWVTDGTAAGTRVFLDIFPGGRADPHGFVRAENGVFYFIATDATAGQELWRTDGTVAGTRRVADVASGPRGAVARILGMSGRNVVFTADDGASGLEPWISDGTAAGTRLLLDVTPGLGATVCEPRVSLGRTVVFGANGTTWATDGTSVGTAQLLPYFAQGIALANRIVLFASEPTGVAMYRTDGTPSGTVRDPFAFVTGFASVAPLASDVASVVVATGGRLACYATTGTSTGTRLLAQLALTGGSWGSLDGLVLVTGDDREHGEEIWVVDAGPTALVDGLGCGRQPDAVRLECSVPRLGALATLRVAHGNASAVVLLGLPPVRPAALNLAAPGCAAFVDVAGPSWSLPLAGNAIALAVPPDPALFGIKLGAQALSGPNAQVGVELSNGLRLTLAW